jgi:IS4 transposase
MHIEKKGWKYAIRVKDTSSSGILSGLKLPDGEFDVDIRLILTRRQTNEVKKNPDVYRFLAPFSSTFEHFDDEGFCPISFRVVRFKLKNGEYEAIITNLHREEFPHEKIRELYHMRWGIETSFRELKHTIGAC